ncbi:MAG: DUF5717 family protein, partial [Lachnospiraceae bacterium]|nr:DUF5717 family protein [Lachnospiraceae bacterium]
CSDKAVIANDDFLGSVAKLKLFILPEHLHKGLNMGTVYIHCSHYCLKYNVIFVNGRNDEEDKQYIEMQKLKGTLLKSFVRYRCKKINAYQWSRESMTNTTKLLELMGDSIRLKLYQVQLLYAAKREREAMELLSSVTNSREFDDVDDEVRGYSIYLDSLLMHDDEYTMRHVDDIVRLRDNNRSSQWLLIFLIYMDVRLERQPLEKLRLLSRQLEISGATPVVLLEIVGMLNENPDLMRNLDNFGIECVWFGMKYRILSRKLTEHIIYLSGQTKHFEPLMHRMLKRLYANEKSDEILTAICQHLIRGEMAEEKYHKYFAMAIERNLRITKLYEYYMYTVPKDLSVLLPGKVRMYFSYGTDLGDKELAYFYANLIVNRADTEEILTQCQSNIVRFALNSAIKGYIDDMMAVVYNYTASLTGYSQKYPFMQALSNLVYKHHIISDDVNAARVVVVENNFTRERVYSLIDGSAYIDVYAGEYELFIETVDGFRYSGEGRIEDKELLSYSLIDYDSIEVEGDTGAIYYACENGRHFITVNEHNCELVKKLSYSEWLDSAYRSELLTQLMEFYYGSEMDERLADLIRNLDWDDITPACRAQAVRLMVVTGMIDDAYNIIEKYGAESIGPKITVKLISHAISDGIYEEKVLLPLAFDTFMGGKYDETLLVYLIDNYEGSVRNLRNLWKAGVNFGLDTKRLEEKILSQMLYSKAFIGEKDEIFASYMQNGMDGSIVRAYLSYSAYEYLIKDRVTDSRVFDRIMALYNRHENLNDVMLLSLILYYSTQDLIDDEVLQALLEIIKQMIKRGIFFGFFAKFSKYLPQISIFEDRTYIEYKTDPRNRVMLNYLISSDNGIKEKEENTVEESGYQIEEMRNLFGGIFSKRMVLFYGETLQYYITEEVNGNSNYTISNAVGMDDNQQLKESRYGMINDMLRCRSIGDEESFMVMLELYLKKAQAVEDLFKPQ